MVLAADIARAENCDSKGGSKCDLPLEPDPRYGAVRGQEAVGKDTSAKDFACPDVQESIPEDSRRTAS